MPVIDSVTNFAKCLVDGYYNDSDTSISLNSGHGAKLPDTSTAGAYNLIWWDASNYSDPADDPNVEIIRCTTRTGDVLTVTRAQEGTSASSKDTLGAQYRIILGITKLTMDNLRSNSQSMVAGPASSTDNAIPVYDGTTGKLLKNSTLIYNSTGLGIDITPTHKLTANLGSTGNTFDNGIRLVRGDGFIDFVNRVTDNGFLPTIIGKPVHGASTPYAFSFRGVRITGMGDTDPNFVLQSANEAQNGAITASQVAIEFRNWTTKLVTVLGNGNTTFTGNVVSSGGFFTDASFQYGMRLVGSVLTFNRAGADIMGVGSAAIYMLNNSAISFSSGTTATGNQATLHLDAPSTLALRSGTSTQNFLIYNTYTNASNYERVRLGYTSDVITFGSEAAGTGTARNFSFVGGNVTINSNLTLSQISTPSNPASGFNRLYFKSDDKLYALNSSGTEVEIGGSGGSGANTALSNLASVAINTSLISDTNDTDDLGSTGVRWRKTWTVDLESTNMPTVGGTAILTSLTAPQFTTIELGHATDTTLARVSAGVVSIEGVNIVTVSSTDTLTNKTLTSPAITTPTGIVKGDVGLGNVDNTSDSTKNSATATLTNKRVTPRVSTEASSATPTINTDNVDAHSITALAADITSMTTNLSGTPTNFQKLIIRIKDNGTARAITWGASFVAMGVALPTTTVISKVLTVGFIYDTVTSKWGCVASNQEA